VYKYNYSSNDHFTYYKFRDLIEKLFYEDAATILNQYL